MTNTKTSSGSGALNQVLSRLNQEGEFSISVLTDPQGLSIASACQNGLDPDRQSAIVALVQKTAVQVGRRLGLAETNEVTVNTADGQRLVCRFFKANSHELILAVTVPSKAQSYRKLTNQAINDIRTIWSSHWE